MIDKPNHVAWAADAVAVFQRHCGTSDEHAIADLICDLGHLTEDDEVFYVLKGDFKVKLGDQIMDAPVGTVMFVPRGVAHAFQNAGNEPGEFLVGVMPGGFEGTMVERVGMDKDAVKALVKKYNMEVAGPTIQ